MSMISSLIEELTELRNSLISGQETFIPQSVKIIDQAIETIKALSEKAKPQQTDLDCISRQSVLEDLDEVRPFTIDGVEEFVNSLPQVVSKMENTTDDCVRRKALIEELTNYYGKTETINIVLDIINNQPQVQQWIPCSERFVEDERT